MFCIALAEAHPMKNVERLLNNRILSVRAEIDRLQRTPDDDEAITIVVFS
jgi:hypothetical protein